MLSLLLQTVPPSPSEFVTLIPWLQLGVGSGILILMLRIAYMMGTYIRRFESVEKLVGQLDRGQASIRRHVVRVEAGNTTMRAALRLIAPTDVRHQVDALLSAANHFEADTPEEDR